MTSGSGIIHQEMPKSCDRLLGVQLWLNMPSENKMGEPRYNDIQKNDIPIVDEVNRKIHIIAGEYNGKSGAIEGDYVKPLYLDVEIDPGSDWSLSVDSQITLFIYILQGAATFVPTHEKIISEKYLVLFDEGNQLTIKASESGVRFLLLGGKPLKEAIAWGGPIVMNTQEQLEIAFKEIEQNTFIK